MTPEDFERLGEGMLAAEVAARVALLVSVLEEADGAPQPDPWADDGEAGTCLGRADY